MSKKKPKERVQLEAPVEDVADWKSEAELQKVTLSEFIRKACRSYSSRLKKKRAEKELPPKGDGK